MENIVSLKDIVVTFDGEQILNDISLDIRDKEFVTLLGPSGCGKTTTLRIIGGFLEPDSGTVTFEGKKINNLPPYKRNVNTVFQRYALFPHLNVYENIAFGLRVKKMPDRDIRKRVGEMLELVNLRGFEKRNIGRLSGGQQQRVAIARALVNQPKVLLLDEPFRGLDVESAFMLRQLILQLGSEGRTVLVAARLAELDGICDDFYVLGGGVGRGRYEHYEFARAVREAAASGIPEK